MDWANGSIITLQIGCDAHDGQHPIPVLTGEFM